MYFGIYCVYYVYCVSLPPKPKPPHTFTGALLSITSPYRQSTAVPVVCLSVHKLAENTYSYKVILHWSHGGKAGELPSAKVQRLGPLAWNLHV